MSAIISSSKIRCVYNNCLYYWYY